jgi:hypothetical protein
LNYFDIASDYGNVVFTRRHRFLSTFLWEVPVGKGRRFASTISGLADQFIGGWQMSGITLLQSGPFLTPTFTGTDPSGTGVLVRGVTTTQRPDRIGDGNLSNPTADRFFERTAFAAPANNIGRFGNAGVGILEGPGTSLRYEATFSNLFNHTNLDVPATLNISSPNFGRITRTQPVDNAGPRTIQMSLRLSF